jgi:hypothetical protein
MYSASWYAFVAAVLKTSVPLALIASVLAAHAGDFIPTAAASSERQNDTGGAAPSRVVTLHHDPQFILQAVAERMVVTLRREIPVPKVLLESKTPLSRLQAAAEQQWGFRPRVFVSAFASAANEIYLIDDAAIYAQRKGTLDDALAHEFAHYLQTKYRKVMLQTDWLEFEAVAIQTWFRAEYMEPTQVAVDGRSAQ